MKGRLLLAGLAALDGFWMLFDAIHYLTTGHYVGAPRVGPWANLASMVGLSLGQMAWIFIVAAMAWLTAGTLLAIGSPHARVWGIVIAGATVWYAPVGTLISVITAILLLMNRRPVDAPLP